MCLVVLLAGLIVAQLVAFHGLKDGRRQTHPAGNDLIGQLRIGIFDELADLAGTLRD